MHHRHLTALPFVLLLAGCVAAPREERAARARVQETGALLHPGAPGPERPILTTDPSLADYLHYALLNHPQVEAAYDEWRGAALAIAPARALPDPKLTFQADITDTLASLMPGLMFDFMSAGRRAAMAREATAASEVAYRRYAAAVLGTAAEVKKAWVDLTALEEILRLERQMLEVKEAAIRFSHAEHVTMHATGSLDELTQLLNDAGRLRLGAANFEDQRGVLRARFKAALGLAREAPDPPWPAQFTPSTAPLPDDDAFWAAAVAANPRLGEMRAMVEMAIAEVTVAEKARTPDFAAGLMADLKMSPVRWRPLGEVTLPVWRGKIAATVAAARARHDAAAARLRAEELTLAADLARMTSMVREADRMIAYLDGTALPNLRRSLASVAAAYGTGTTEFAAIPETQEMLLAMQAERLAVLREREKTLADLSLLVAGQAPADAPLPVATASTP